MGQLWMLSLSLFVLAWLLDFSFPPRKPPLVNYDSEVFFDPSPLLGPLSMVPKTTEHSEMNTFLAPQSKEELITIIKSIAGSAKGKGERSRKLRVIGSGHSWSQIAKSDDLHMSLYKYKGLVSVNKETHQATFRGGTSLKEVNALLEDHGLAMSQLGSISDQTVAGAIATGTHGTGIKVGNLATFVTRIELVSGKGELLTFSVDDNLFKAAQVNLGLLGVVTEVTFQCEPSFNLEETRSILPLDECLGNMQSLVASADHVKMWIEVFSEKCVLHRTNRTKERPRDNLNPLKGLVEGILYDVYISILSWVPSLVPVFMKLLFKQDPMQPHNRVDVSYRVFNIPFYFPTHNEAEFVVGMKDCASAIRELKRFVEREKIPLNYITEIRFVQEDDIFLSPNYHRDSCHLTLCIKNPSDVDRLRYFSGFFQTLADRGFKPRIHWGKYFNLTSKEVHRFFPKLNTFLDIRERLDPDQILVSVELAKTLGI